MRTHRIRVGDGHSEFKVLSFIQVAAVQDWGAARGGGWERSGEAGGSYCRCCAVFLFSPQPCLFTFVQMRKPRLRDALGRGWTSFLEGAGE